MKRQLTELILDQTINFANHFQREIDTKQARGMGHRLVTPAAVAAAITTIMVLLHRVPPGRQKQSLLRRNQSANLATNVKQTNK